MTFFNINFITVFISLLVGYRMLMFIFPIRVLGKFKKIQYVFCFSILLVVIIHIFNLLLLPNILTLLFSILYIVVTSMNLFDTKLRYIIGAISVHFLIVTIYNSFGIFLSKWLVTIRSNNYETTVFFVYMLHGISFLLLPLIYRLAIPKIGTKFFIKYYMALFLFSVAIMTILLLYSKHSFEYINEELLPNQLGFFVLGVLTLFLIILCMTYYEKEEEKERIELKREMSQENFNRVREIYEANAKVYHDLNNHLLVLHNMIEQEETKKALEYITNISEPILETYYQKEFTSNSVINLLLNRKIELMIKENISYEIEIDVPIVLKIADNDMVTILANILDNAIEACEKIQEGDRMIKLTIKKIKQMMFIKLENTFLEEYQIQGHIWKSSKIKTKHHGWGMKSVVTVVEKYEGIITNKTQGNMFIVVISLSDNEWMKAPSKE
ncbi:sensor histidine kinase [Enterococcus quebecensis]|uniref:Sensor histidine kinase NatK-like C-terminal domain-containing protein n=1 Tax=Enterococcus quebecensis TaxID=903983 RepID=A0A1E5GUA2_9ENTE|nr:sensor histidine kinase [Enterococcus quebecensis]OEG16247.1 hypothetical protein BCR23_05000 [Enterococcus quebecensis]